MIPTALAIALSITLITQQANAQQTLQEQLGYNKNTRLVILHADDLGMSHSVNTATFDALTKGPVNSSAIMVPAPWFNEVVAFAAQHPKADLGLHLTLTSEWKNIKWGPVAPAPEVPGLVNRQGFLYSSVDSVYRTATVAEVEKELRAQIERARAAGIDITHLDSHMGTLFGRADYFKVLIRLGKEYKLPVMLSKAIFLTAFHVNLDTLHPDAGLALNMLYMANPADYQKGMNNFYAGVLKTLPAGVSEIIFHLGYDDSELKGATAGHDDYGAAWRQADYNFFTSEECRKLLKQQNIQLVTWREIRDRIIRRGE